MPILSETYGIGLEKHQSPHFRTNTQQLGYYLLNVSRTFQLARFHISGLSGQIISRISLFLACFSKRCFVERKGLER